MLCLTAIPTVRGVCGFFVHFTKHKRHTRKDKRLCCLRLFYVCRLYCSGNMTEESSSGLTALLKVKASDIALLINEACGSQCINNQSPFFLAAATLSTHTQEHHSRLLQADASQPAPCQEPYVDGTPTAYVRCLFSFSFPANTHIRNEKGEKLRARIVCVKMLPAVALMCIAILLLLVLRYGKKIYA